MAGSFMEVPVDPCSSCGCSNTIVLNVKPGEETSIGSLEGIYPDNGGGFSYTKDSKITRQRQIIWKVIGNVVNLEEISLGHNLFGNKLEIHIPNEVILSNVIIKESEEEVNVFIATTRTIHQLIFVHPNHCKYGFIIPSGIHVSFPSVFNNASEEYKHRSAELSQLCTAFDVACTIDGEVYFGLVTGSKTLLVANLTDAPEECSCVELKDASVMQRLWTGLVPSFVRGDSTWMGVESVIMHSFGPDEIFAFTLCKDLKMRVWSVKRQCCVLTKDLVSLIPETEDSQPEMVGALSVKKANTPSSKQLILAAHCCFAYSSKFIVLEVFKEQRDVVIMHVSNFYSCFNSIQDVSLTSHFLCVLWNTPDGGHSISYAPIEGGKDYEKGWHPVHTKQSDKEDLFIPMYQDAKEIYLEKIFSPGTFNKESILKALQVFIKTLDIEASEIPGANTEVAVIKEAIIRILELEIERNVVTRDIHPSDYQELQHQCWLKYFSFVQQCYQAREKPLGLYMSESDDLSMVIRQEACGYLHNTDWIDHLYLTELASCEDLSSYIENEIGTTNESSSQDIMIIMKCLKSIADEFTSEVILGIDHDLDRNADVKSFLTSMAATLLTNNSDFEQLVGDPIQRGSYLSQLEDRLKHIQNPEKSIEVLMAALQSHEPAKMPMFDQTDSSLLTAGNNSQFLCGKIGIDLLTQLLKQVALNRMHLCRDLFILLKLMDKIGLSRLVSADFGTIISNSCYELLKSYHTVYWSAKTNFVKAETSTIDSNLNLAALHLSERSKSTTIDTSIDELPVSLLASFIRNVGMKKLLEDTNMNMMKMGDYSKSEMIKFVMNAILHHVWVLNENVSDFPEYLSHESQYCALLDYLHFCDQWCSAGRGTKDYLLAQAYLGIGEPHKALSYFFTAARGISMKEPLLMSLTDGNTSSRQRYLTQYFIKVMRLFEHFEYPTYVISAASSALTVATKEDASIPMLWSVIFKYYLELGHYSDAYATIVHNTDKIRRHDCLRHFIVTLCDAGLFQEICSFPYTNLEEEVVSIIEARARTTDITVNRYYDLLYSYHVIKCDYRRASTAMYEHACRLQTEMHGTKALQKQAKCYLAAITALKLVKAKDAWIVRPQVKVSTVENKQPEQQYSQSPKRRDDGEVVFYSTTKKKKCGTKALIVEIAHLEKEYLLIFSRLKLVQNKKTDNITLGPSVSAAETVGLLAQAGLFDIAFSVALKFKLPLKRIFESLAAKCAQLVNHKPSELDEQWKWLSKNELCTSQILTVTNATDQAFHLLQAYLKRFQKDNSSVHYKAVTSKFLSMGCSLPSWLITLYEYSNPAELLHVYLCYDMVLEATQLALKYVDAVLGHGKEYLGLNTALHATSPAVWLPYTSFDQLLTALRANYEKPEAAKLCGELQDKLDDYFMKSEIVSCDKLNYLYTVNNSMAIQ